MWSAMAFDMWQYLPKVQFLRSLSVVMWRPVLKSAGLVHDGSVGKSAGELSESIAIQRMGSSGLTLYLHVAVR